MCGICGFYDAERALSGGEALLARMNEAQKHRGPDDRGTFLDGPVGLGHVRLSILDLSPSGHQPMHFGERYTIVYNGEIYNYIELREELKKAGYTFHTQCDTEVVLAAYACWGEAARAASTASGPLPSMIRRAGSSFSPGIATASSPSTTPKSPAICSLPPRSRPCCRTRTYPAWQTTA